ncbi:2-hydroxyacid dehydrogenase [Halalkalibacter urbisdiaboli]|uniref:2-hydroxyacid dehydrogenase n=1 Tax=Halalkalibacter urbisdiaboli TaxID=1960589 RepID=UPI000B433567|nr:D-glycerate dehydrogenase [Halalkalibacter urbisdiaboli]
MKVVVTRKLPNEIIDLFSNVQVVVWDKEDEPMPRERLLLEIEDADGLLTNLSDAIDKELLERATKLKVISTMAVGFDNIDVEEATKRGIAIGHTPGVLTEATADLTFSLLLASARRLVEGVELIREDKWASWSPFLLTGQQVYGATIGIIGMGRIGLSVARRAKGFSMNVLYHNRSRHSEAEREVSATYCSLDELLERSDFIVLLAPSTPDTYRMIGKEQFAKMKKTAVFINTSRGTNVDEAELYEALVNQEIYAAGLDVFENEPITSKHPLLKLKNVTAVPHIGSASIQTRMEMAKLAVENVLLGLAAQPLKTQVPSQG